MSTTEDRVARAVRDVFEFGATQPSQFSPADIRRHRSRRWPHRAVVLAVAAAILAVFFVPLPHASLFKRLVSSARPSTATSLPTTGPSTATSVPTTVTSTTVFQLVKVPSDGVVGHSVSSARDVLMAAGFKVFILHPAVFLKYRPGQLCHNHLSEAGLACTSRCSGLSNCLQGKRQKIALQAELTGLEWDPLSPQRVRVQVPPPTRTPPRSRHSGRRLADHGRTHRTPHLCGAKRSWQD